MVNDKKMVAFLSDITILGGNYDHLRNVESFGLLLLKYYPNADEDVVRWFSCLHDCKKESLLDTTHGQKAAKFIDEIRHSYLSDLSDEQIEKLKMACHMHTSTIKTNDITINVCFDADRLDFPRHGGIIDPERMATDYGKKLSTENYNKLVAFVKENIKDVHRPESTIQYFDKFSLKAGEGYCGFFAIHFSLLLVNGKIISPFTRTEWIKGHKSLKAEKGISAIPFEWFVKERFLDTFHNYIDRSIIKAFFSLLEYRKYNLINRIDTYFNSFFYPIDGDARFATSEVHLNGCNIVCENDEDGFTEEFIESGLEELYNAYNNKDQETPST